MPPAAVTITKIQDSPTINSKVYDVIFPSGHRGDQGLTTNLNPSTLNARYTVIRQEFLTPSASTVQIIKHNRGTQLAPLRFKASMVENSNNKCIVERQFDYDMNRLKVSYSVSRENGIHEVDIADEELMKFDGIANYTLENREDDLFLALDVGAFFLEWVFFEQAEESAKDNDEWVILDKAEEKPEEYDIWVFVDK